ncbi:MAG: hypothetical protein MJ066_01255 [Clostridia bacterium]|nr:hypothetical protein [Clostridia bacterium]
MNVNAVSVIAILIALFLGLVFGFGRGLKIFNNGIVGKIISVIITYCLFGIVLSWQFVGGLLDKFVDLLDPAKWYFRVLRYIRIDIIVFAVVLYLVVRIVNKLLIGLISGVFEANNKVILSINKILGMILFVIMLFVFVLFMFQIIAWIEGATVESSFYQKLEGSFLRLDRLYLNNPLMSIVESFKNSIRGAK